MKKILLLVSILLLFPSCSSISYVMHVGYGQLKLFNKAKPVEEVIQSEKTTENEKKILSELPHIREYARTVGLKENSNYKTYVKLDQPYVVYVVAASDPLAFKEKLWSFPIVGSFNYLGFHDEKKARSYADEIKKDENLDVSVRGAGAYSTLGWFSDPLLSSMILPHDFGLGYFADLIIHETVHVTVYIPGQSYFNESLASFFADQVTPVYLKNRFGEKSKEFIAYADYAKKSDLYGQNFLELYRQLEKLYAQSDLGNEEKLLQKKNLIEVTLKKIQYKKTDVNNATLVQYKTYGVGQTEFTNLFNFLEKNPQRFIECLSLVKKDFFQKEHEENFQPLVDRLTKNECSRLPQG